MEGEGEADEEPTFYAGIPLSTVNSKSKLYDIQDGPDRNRLRATFGIPLKRRLGNGGILVMGLRYWCEPLRQHFLDRGNVDIDVRLDGEDVSEISVLIDGTWHAASCIPAPEHATAPLAKSPHGPLFDSLCTLCPQSCICRPDTGVPFTQLKVSIP